MKKAHKYLLAFPIIAVAMVIGMASCSKHDQLLDLTTPPNPVLNTDTLNAIRGTAALQAVNGEAWDGTIEGVWNNAPKLTVHAVVPDLGNNTFTGFVGNNTDITLRSMYDANNIYFLVEFDAPEKNVKSAQWYFNPAQTDMTKKWAQEATAVSLTNLSPDGSYRPSFAQDQFAMMWNISNSCPKFNSLSCYAACHVSSSYGGTLTPDGGLMYTNGPSERLDVWRARMLQVVNVNQSNDCFIDDGSSIGPGYSGVIDKNQVHGDWQVNNGSSAAVPSALQSPVLADGGFSNAQTITISNKTSKKAKVPLWVIPSAAGVNPYSNSAILLKDTLSGKAVKVISVDSLGVLSLANGTKIDPTVGTDYKQIGAGDGPRCIPGSIVGSYTGSRGDVTTNAFHTGRGWRILFKRALKTSDATYDVDFSTLADLPFGVGVMFNQADNQHAIVAGLKLHFQ